IVTVVAASASTPPLGGGQLGAPLPIFDRVLLTSPLPAARQALVPNRVLWVPADGGRPPEGLLAQAVDAAMAASLGGRTGPLGSLETTGVVVPTARRGASNDGVSLGGNGYALAGSGAGRDLVIDDFGSSGTMAQSGRAPDPLMGRSDLDLFFASLGDAARER